MVTKEYFNNERGTVCSKCNKQKAKLKVASSGLDMAHGFYIVLCKDCYIKSLFEEKKLIEEELKKMKRVKI